MSVLVAAVISERSVLGTRTEPRLRLPCVRSGSLRKPFRLRYDGPDEVSALQSGASPREQLSEEVL